MPTVKYPTGQIHSSFCWYKPGRWLQGGWSRKCCTTPLQTLSWRHRWWMAPLSGDGAWPAQLAWGLACCILQQAAGLCQPRRAMQDSFAWNLQQQGKGNSNSPVKVCAALLQGDADWSATQVDSEHLCVHPVNTVFKTRSWALQAYELFLPCFPWEAVQSAMEFREPPWQFPNRVWAWLWLEKGSNKGFGSIPRFLMPT